MNYLAWTPEVVIEKVYMKKPANGVSAISGGYLLRAGTPLNNSKAVANTENAKYLVAEDFIFYNDPHDNGPVKLITAGYVDLAKAQAAWGREYEDDAIAALATAGIILVDGATLPAGGGGLPDVTSDDNGDVLTVVEGEWAKAAPSGGGVLIVTDTDGTLDKTWQEIHDAMPLAFIDGGGAYYLIGTAVSSGNAYVVVYTEPTQAGNAFCEYETNSADEYPTRER